jgi:hypothetical protein
LGAAEDKSLPRLGSEAPSIEVAANFTGIYRILMSKDSLEAKTVDFAVTKVPVGMNGRVGLTTKRAEKFLNRVTVANS